MTDRVRLLTIDDDVVDRLAIRRAIEQSGMVAEMDEAIPLLEAAGEVLGMEG